MPSHGMKDREWFRNKDTHHFKNEGLFACLTKATVLEQLNMLVEFNWTKKLGLVYCYAFSFAEWSFHG